jgi:hypothetical protein
MRVSQNRTRITTWGRGATWGRRGTTTWGRFTTWGRMA